MVKRGSIWRMSALWAAIGALSISTRCFAQEHDQLKNVLSEALLASPPGSTRNSATEDLFDGPLANCTLRGPIENAQCNYEQVDAINEDFHTQLQSIVTTPYFRYYKTDLDKSCPFWPDDALCTNRNCAVQTLDDRDVPEKYRMSTLSSVSTTPDQVVADLSGGSGPTSCHCDETEFCHWDDEYSTNAVFVDLQRNPERFTGYAGPSANRIWKSIYDENCFGLPGKASGAPARISANTGIGMSSDMSMNPAAAQAFASFLSSMQTEQQYDSADADENDVCLEKRVFYRIVSGLHASISIHICDEFLDTETGVWGPSEKCFRFRIANYPERLQNLYFDYVLFLRALARIGEQVASQPNFTISSPGNEIDDLASKEQFGHLLASATRLKPTFDEHTMFAGPDAAGLREEFKHRFRNITSIMDCVGCDKCRLWGKLQTSGVATALKILFAYDDQDNSKGAYQSLKRSELVALVNTANRFAESLKAVERFRSTYQHTLIAASEASRSSGGKNADPHAAYPSSSEKKTFTSSTASDPPSSSSSFQESAFTRPAYPPDPGTPTGERSSPSAPSNQSPKRPPPPASFSSSTTQSDQVIVHEDL